MATLLIWVALGIAVGIAIVDGAALWRGSRERKWRRVRQSAQRGNTEGR